MANETLDSLGKAEEFQNEFAALVRKYLPEYPRTPAEEDLLAMMQERTSCYSPYVWTDKFRPKALP